MQLNSTLIKTECKEWLKQFGYPNCTNETIMSNLPGMFNMLLEKKLVEVEMEQSFHSAAAHMYMLNQMGGFY